MMLPIHIDSMRQECCPFTDRRETCSLPHLGVCPVMESWSWDHHAMPSDWGSLNMPNLGRDIERAASLGLQKAGA
jgi:hypothetical protein